MKHLITYLLWLALAATLPLTACGSENKEETQADGFGLQVELPGAVDVPEGGTCTFDLEGEGGLRSSDSFVMESEAGVSYVCPFVEIDERQFSVRIPKECESGYYNASLRREGRKKPLGRIYLHIVDELDFRPDQGTTVYGRVMSDAGAVVGAVVSDGTEVTTTNSEGIYQLRSQKERGYVFVSIPGGYEAEAKGVLPQFYQTLKAAAGTPERIDFSLRKVDGQEQYKIYMLGDMHLANRTNDSRQFMDFTADLNDYRSRHNEVKSYAIALGDMTWDLYWYSNSYAIPDYLNTINSQVRDLQIFHVIGNHDNDYKATSDREAGSQFVHYIAPTYYSFNIGKIHYIVLDDIDCDEYDGTTSRHYRASLSNEQLDWLAKDLDYVDRQTPLVVALHAPVFYPEEKGDFRLDHDATSTNRLLDLLKGREVHFVSGHTHLNYNVTPEATICGGERFYEHNTGAVCSSWWWSGYLTPGIHISLDGNPGGYGIWDVNGTDIQWLYKATGRTEEHQFRCYDLNQVHFSMADVPQMPANVPDKVKAEYMKYVDAYPANSDNEVLINVWNWNPRWTISVSDEAGNRLEPVAVWAYDPLHIAALSVKRFNSATLKSVPSFITEKFTHFFRVQAPDADTDLTITVSDEFGHVWTERMERPKAFSTEAYLNN